MKTYRGENPEQHLVEFLKEIDAEAIRKYERIDELFVPPIEYENIRNSLSENRIIFLTGTKEYGKTYVAVSLLWEYFKEGYNLLWFKGDRDEDRSRTRSNLLNIQKYLKPSHIIYFEDPFGKTKYEATDDEALTKNIGSIIDTVAVSDDAYVIITSREEIFKEFKQRVSVETDLNKFEKRLIMKAPSYDFKRRSQMLLNWAKVMRCKWLQDEDLTHMIIEAMKDDRILSTPLNIEQFALATVNVSTRDKLLQKVQSKSKDTPRSFAEVVIQ